MLSVISVFFLSIVVFIFLFCALTNLRLTNKSIRQLIIIAIICFFFYSMTFEAKEQFNSDLTRHFQLLDRMRDGGIGYVINDSEYKSQFIYNWFAFIVSLTPINGLLCAIPVLLELLFVYSLICECFELKTNALIKVEYSSQFYSYGIIYVLFVWFAFFNFDIVLQNIRTTLALTIGVWAIWNEFVKQKRGLQYIIGYIVPFFIHEFGLIIVLIRILLVLRVQFYSIFGIAILFLLLFGQHLFSLLSNGLGVLNPFGALAFNAAHYLEEYSLFSAYGRYGSATIIRSFGDILLFCYILLLIFRFFHKRMIVNETDGRIIKLIEACTIPFVGFCVNYVLTQRYFCVIGYIFIPFYALYYKTCRKLHLIDYMVLFLAILVDFCIIYPLISNALGFTFLTFH